LPNPGAKGILSDWQTVPCGGVIRSTRSGDPRLVDAGAGIVKADVAVAVVGEQDGVSEPPRGSHRVDVGSRPHTICPAVGPSRLSASRHSRARRVAGKAILCVD
jgi:hypothetical protein